MTKKAPKRNEIIKKLKKSLDPERFEHSLRVEKVALALGKKYHVDLNSISLAAILHDCARRYDRKELLKMAKKMKLKTDPVKKLEPKLFHGEIGARLARDEFNVKSKDVLRAIRNHTTGAPGMSKLEKIIYLSDHIEDKRAFPGVKKLRNLAFNDLDRAIFESASSMLRFLLQKKMPIHPETVRTRNNYIMVKA